VIENPIQPANSSAPRRLVSVDALRGFDMFWIMGGDQIVRSLPKIHDSPLTRALAAQMDHCEWAGFHFYDLIFPLFVFIVGVSLVFSIPRIIERDGRPAAIKRIVIRSVILFLLGIFYMGGLANGFKNVYLAGVLHRIAVAYFFAALIFCFFGSSPSPPEERAGERRPTQFRLFIMISLCFLLLIGYWALLTFVPVPGIGAPSLDGPGKNLGYYIDQLYLPGQKFEGTLLSTMAAVANCLLGVLAALLLKNPTIPDQKKVYWLLGSGIASLAVGFAWAQEFPIIKLLWTSSYVLVACGYSAILLAIFLQVIDIWKFQQWAQPFVWMGMNAITIYIVANVVNFHKLAARFVGGDVSLFLGNYAPLIQALVSTAFAFCLVHFLYRRKIFLRL
jgi:predicted acyltransferase